MLAFCDFNFIMKHFKFLKTVAGKGFFNCFLASMFLVGNDGEVWGYVMLSGLLFCGVFFILVGCACVAYEDKDLSKDDLKRSTVKGSMNESEAEPLTA